jgi:aminotransferase
VSESLRVAPRVRAITLPPFDPLNGRAAELRAAGHHVISLGQALPFFPPPPAALDAARKAIGRADINLYSTDPGRPRLRAALADRLAGMLGTPVGPSDLVITAGANHAFALALTTLVDPGDEVVLPSPYFTNHHMAVAAMGATPVEAPVADRETFALRWSDIEPCLSGKTRAVVLCNPSNPTGAPLDASNGAAILDALRARGIAVISDETYMHFVYEGLHWSAASAPRWRDHVVVVGSCSKSFGMMGWRVGFLLADAAVCTEVVKVQDAMIICAPVIGQVAAEAAVCDAWTYPGTFHDELRRRRQVVEEGLRTLPALSWHRTRAGLFAFTRVEGCHDSMRLALDLLERAHVVTMPGAVFGAAGEGYLRLSYGVAGADDLEEALRRLGRYFGEGGDPVRES